MSLARIGAHSTVPGHDLTQVVLYLSNSTLIHKFAKNKTFVNDIKEDEHFNISNIRKTKLIILVRRMNELSEYRIENVVKFVRGKNEQVAETGPTYGKLSTD